MVVGDFPHMGQLLRIGTHRFLVQTKIRQDKAAPDLLRLQLPLPGIPVSAVTFPAGVDRVGSGFKILVGVNTVGAENIQHPLYGGVTALVVYMDIFQSSAHIKQYGVDHSFTAFSVIYVVNGCPSGAGPTGKRQCLKLAAQAPVWRKS